MRGGFASIPRYPLWSSPASGWQIPAHQPYMDYSPPQYINNIEMPDAASFNREIVEPTLEEFFADYSSLRRAFTAVAVLDALAAQIFVEAQENGLNAFELLGWHHSGDPPKPDDSIFRKRISENCTAFRIIRDVAKANKHCLLTRDKPLVSRSAQTNAKPMKSAIGRIVDGRPDGSTQVVVQLDDLQVVYLEHQLAEAHDTLVNLVELLEQRIS